MKGVLQQRNSPIWLLEYGACRCGRGTNTFTDETNKSPLGSTLNMNDERAIAPRRAMRQDDANAETLLIRAYMLCMVVVVKAM